MNFFSKARIKKLLRKYRISPLKRLGQNFLVDKRVVKKIIETAELSPNDIVLEVGPGIGNLTQELAKKVKKVIAIEKDLKMIKILKEVVSNFQNIEIIKEDILKLNSNNLKAYKLVANIPYYLTSPLIRKFLEAEVKPSQMVLLIQKEVAQRICPKTKKINLLAVSVQFYARPKIISFVSKNYFWPQPKVDSAIIKITPYINKYQADKFFIRKFFQIVRAGFSQPRKQLLNNLANSLKLNKEGTKNWLLKNNIKPERRAETLSLDDWINLTKSFTIKQ